MSSLVIEIKGKNIGRRIQVAVKIKIVSRARNVGMNERYDINTVIFFIFVRGVLLCFLYIF